MYHFEWESAADHQQNLIDVCYDLEEKKSSSGVASNIKQGLYESNFDFFTLENDSIQALLEFCRHSVFQSAHDANRSQWPANARVGINVHESWCHITRTGGYHDMHVHPNSSWSGIYYIRTGECDVHTKNGSNRFYNPMLPGYSDISTRWCSMNSSFDMQPRDGQLIVFPSWIMHSATPYSGTTDRIVVAFNCQFIDGTA